MKLSFALLAVSPRLPMGCQNLNLQQSDNPDFSTVIFPQDSIAATFHNLIYSSKQYRRKRSC